MVVARPLDVTNLDASDVPAADHLAFGSRDDESALFAIGRDIGDPFAGRRQADMFDRRQLAISLNRRRRREGRGLEQKRRREEQRNRVTNHDTPLSFSTL